MKVELDSSKSLHENAASYFEKAKRLREKRASLVEAIADVERKISESEKQAQSEKKEAPKLVEKTTEKKQWFERFNHFTTTGGRLCIAGKDASQNEIIVKHYFEEGDLFFHADIQGAAATVLKDGVKADAQEKLEAAQFSACFSRAWKSGFASVDVYCVGKDQVSKSAESGEYVGKGGFIIRGKREWFKNTELKAAVGFDEKNKLRIVPDVIRETLHKFISLTPGEKKANGEKAARTLSIGREKYDELMAMLP